MPSPSHRDAWLSLAAKVRRRVNLAWWLETLAAPLLFAGLVIAAAFLLLRRLVPEISIASLAAACACVAAAIALSSWFISRRRFESIEQALVRLEAKMGLHNALSTANAGISPWPEPPARTGTGLHWHWPRLVIPPLASLALLAAGLLVPVSGIAGGPPSALEQPQGWTRLDSQLDHLAREEVVDESYLDEMRRRLDELRSQKEEQWFSHSSLEATDSLEKSHRTELDRLDRELDRAGNALDALEQRGDSMSREQRDKHIQEFDQALQELQSGAMKPNPQLLEQMKQLDPKNLGKLSPEQMRQLRENLAKHRDAMKQGQNGQGDDWADELLANEDGNGENGGGKEGKNGLGQGGVERGPGHAPGVLGDESSAIETGELTALEAEDLSNALPGDLLQLQDGEHEVDTSASRVSRGGDIDAVGSGGDRVWQDSLDPDEQRTLKRFYE